MDPLVAVANHITRGHVLPFDWVVLYAPEGDPERALQRAWAAAEVPSAMRQVLVAAGNPELLFRAAAAITLCTVVARGDAAALRHRSTLRRLADGQHARKLPSSKVCRARAHGVAQASWDSLLFFAAGRNNLAEAITSQKALAATDLAVGNALYASHIDRTATLAAHDAAYAAAIRAHVPCPAARACHFTLGA